MFALIGLIERQHIVRVGESFRSLESNTTPSLTALLESIMSSQRASIKAVEYAIRGIPKDRDKSHQAMQQLEKQIQQYLQLNNSAADKTSINQITILKNHYRDIINDYLSLAEGPDIKQIFKEEETLHKDRRKLIQTINNAIQQAQEIFKYDLLQIKSEARNVSIQLKEFTMRGKQNDKKKAQSAVQMLFKSSNIFKKKSTEYPELSKKLSTNVDTYISTATAFLQLLSIRENSVDSIYLKEEELHQARTKFINALYPLVTEQYKILDQAASTTTTQLDDSAQLQLYSILIITFIAMLAAYLLARSISTPLTNLTWATRKIGEGTLDVNLIKTRGIHSRDEIGDLASSFQQMTINLTQQKKQLKESEEKFSKAFFDQPIAMEIVDLGTGKRIEINQKYCELMGFPRDELINTSIYEKNLWIKPELQELAAQAVKSEGYIDAWPMKILQKSGKEKNILLSAATLKLDKQNLIIATLVDITDRIQLEQQLRSKQQHLEQNIQQRNQELEKLRQTEERLKNAQHIARIGNWELELSTNKLLWSDEIFQIFEIDQQKFGASYEAFLYVIHPDDRDKARKAYENSLKSKKPYSIEYRLLVQGGSVKYVIEKCETTFSDKGTPIKSTGTVQDITEQKYSESLALRMNHMFEHSVEEIYIFDGETLSFLKVSTGALKNLGYSIHEISSLTPVDIKPDFNEKQFRHYIKPLKSGKELQLKFETRHQRKDGSSYPVEVSLQYASEDSPPVFLAIIEDVTQRKKIETELESHRFHLEKLVEERTATIKKQASIIDQTNDAVVTVDTENNITGWNGGAERLFKIPGAKALGQSILLVYPENSEQFLQQEIVTPAKEKGVHELDIQLKRGDGTEFPAHLSLSMLYDKDDTPTGMVGYTIDLTEQQKREQELTRLTRKLQDSNRELEAFSYSVSHDLRSPLRSIDGFSQAVVEDYGDHLDDTAKDYLNRVRKAAQRMGILIDELLDLSRVNRGEISWQKLDLNKIAQRAFDELKSSEPQRQVELIMDKNLQIQGDARLFEVVMNNLIGNAWKFTVQQEKARITIKSLPDKPDVFYIKDNGVGFDMRHAGKLFGVFQRLHQVSEFPGTGVGLATTQRIIHRHGGQIWAESEPGKGATFFFTVDSNNVFTKV